MDKIKFQTNVPVEVALRFTEGKLCDSQFGDPQYMFSTMDDRAFFVAAKVAQKIHGLRLKPGELIDIVKAEVPYTNGRKGIEWQITRVNPPAGEPPNPPVGAQPDGTFTVPAPPSATRRIAPAAGQSGASVSAPAPVTAAPTSPAQPPNNGNSSTGGSKAAERFWAGKSEAEQSRPTAIGRTGSPNICTPSTPRSPASSMRRSARVTYSSLPGKRRPPLRLPSSPICPPLTYPTRIHPRRMPPSVRCSRRRSATCSWVAPPNGGSATAQDCRTPGAAP